MLKILANRTYRHLFLAQVVALLGTGLATVALGLLAYDLAGSRASVVLGALLTIKMLAYVTLAPIAGALAERLPRRTFLVALDVVRLCVALALPFVDQIWQIYALVFLLQAASAGFTPVFQATIPDVLTDEAAYTRALSLSRLAYDLESLASPMLAALALAFVSYNALFLGTAAGFAASTLLVATVFLPSPQKQSDKPLRRQVFHGTRIYLGTPRLRGALALNLAAACVGSMVLVNSVLLVRGELGLSARSLALMMGAFGFGSMLTALLLPHQLDRMPERRVMASGATVSAIALLLLAFSTQLTGLHWSSLALSWFFIGAGYSATLTPFGRLLRRSSHPEDRPAIFAAQFALSHVCWLFAYPLSAALMTALGAEAAMFGLSLLAFCAIGLGMRLWPAQDIQDVWHSHADLPHDHPHLAGHARHRHSYVIDDLHKRWPTRH